MNKKFLEFVDDMAEINRLIAAYFGHNEEVSVLEIFKKFEEMKEKNYGYDPSYLGRCNGKRPESLPSGKGELQPND